ncbi:MAG: LptF/LptG family permease [Bacteroidetes bacterium]|nr:LptF/LptG family permease [Bacteroidota bacterium]
MRIKKLDWLVFKSFVGPFVLTFFIAQFVLVMQFLWKYVDDLVGKGLNTWVLMELMMYASARLVPLALPLAVLLASIMTYGSLGEHYELTAVKSTGVSLLRFMRALIITVVGISLFAFYFSNYVMPATNLKFGALLYDIRHQKPTMALKAGIFYNGLDGFFIRVDAKDDETNTLYNVTVYDHTSGKGNDHVITAEKGSMTQDDAAMALTLKLENGKQYKEIDPKDPGKNNYSMVYTSFTTWEKRFDLSQFKLSRTDENYFKDLKQMLDLKQLYGEIDTLKRDEVGIIKGLKDYNRTYYSVKKFGLDTIHAWSNMAKAKFVNTNDLLTEFDKTKKIQVMEIAMNRSRNIKNYIEVTTKQLEYKERELVMHYTEVYRKFTLSIACLVLFFIGAPLGSIIRKGGLGWPLFYCVLFFIIYHVSSIIGEKLAEGNSLTVFSGMWLSTFILTPVGLFLTLKANSDSKIYSPDFYVNVFRKVFKPSTQNT